MLQFRTVGLLPAVLAAQIVACTPAGERVSQVPKPALSASTQATSAPPLPLLPTSSAGAEIPPNPPDFLAELAALPADPTPEKITLNTHYVISNEDKPEVLRAAVSGRGGAYIGVGAEQSYLFAGWARADIMLLFDFDDWVVEINEVYAQIFTHAESPDDTIQLWGPDSRDRVKTWIIESAPNRTVADARIKVFTEAQPKIFYRLKWLKNKLSSPKVPFFGNDKAELDHIANLWRQKKARAVRGDLTAATTLSAFGNLARRAKWPVRVVYLSNAELYFPYEQGQYRANLANLPFDEKSIILHTQPIDSKEYHYIWQNATEYTKWIAQVRTYRDLLEQANMPRSGKFENGAWQIFPA
ncbi:MAG: hypothetical protein IPK82_41650 [Polyangiaceae bacterium]|nr:hypothetical protein [Polyangiaceae bacterium]